MFKTSRRAFLKIIGAVLFGVSVGPHGIFAQKRKKTCIIGAGFSGLAAAYKLKSAGLNVTIPV